MAQNTEAPNPLRPYYVPPSIGLPSTGPSSQPPLTATVDHNPANRINHISSSARNLLPDFDYADYLAESSPTLSEGIKDLIDQAIFKYTSVLLLQPFDLAKTILQVYTPPAEDDNVRDGGAASMDKKGRVQGRGRRRGADSDRGTGPARDVLSDEEEEEQGYGERENIEDEFLDEPLFNHPQERSESSEDEAAFFTSSNPIATPSQRSPYRKRRSNTRRMTDRRGYIPPSSLPQNILKLENRSSLMDVIKALYNNCGATSIWKGTNAAFIYGLLSNTLNAFLRGLLSAIFALPDDAVSTIAEPDLLLATSSPFTALAVTCVSTAVSALILSPIDTTRTYLMLTPAAHGPRSLIRAIRRLPSPYYMIPSHLVTITVFSSTLPSLIANSAPIILRNHFSLDPFTNTNAWSILTFIASGFELAVRYPLETVLRRAQIATYTSPALRQQTLDQQQPAGPLPPMGSSQRSQSQGQSQNQRVVGGGGGEAPPLSGSSEFQQVQTIVPVPQSYRGIIATIWSIVYEEGSRPVGKGRETSRVLGGGAFAAGDRDRDSLGGSRSEVRSRYSMTTSRPGQLRRRKGQGVAGLYRGWRLGTWSMVGVWGSGFLGSVLGGEAEGGISSSAGGRF
ncbi:mitochondrial fusion and transport protein ugo1 [Ascosphaera aggregata]|nr:mitochondrial fusion and transport protein ugo1 [Ascosphaera aggregata]